MHWSSFCVKPCCGFTSSQNCAFYQWCPKIGANGNWRKECVDNICNFRCFSAIGHSHMWKIKMFFFVKIKFQTQTSHQIWIIKSSFYVSVCFESGPILVCPPPTVGSWNWNFETWKVFIISELGERAGLHELKHIGMICYWVNGLVFFDAFFPF